ncbi:hypothetical protein WM11_11340 [Burkholderia ubonensis]|nr:hypothetical protein WM11_11340 [Burkholderia ubonensis]KWK56476.1 hypothetical protein WM14_26840 [Burkholderia ubonensis]
MAVELIGQRHPEADPTAVQRFVQDQFAAMNADPSVTISAEGIAQRYDEAAARQQAGDTRIQADIAKLLLKLLRQKADHQHLQLFELQVAFQNATSMPLSSYTVELQAVLDGLQERRYITAKRRGNRIFAISQGLDFDEWSRAMTGGNKSKVMTSDNKSKVMTSDNKSNAMTSANESRGPVIYNYNVSGHNARVNIHSTDQSTNIVGDGAKVQEQLAALRREIDAAGLLETERQAAHDVVDAVDAQFSAGAPKKSIVTALLAPVLTLLPKAANVASITSAILALARAH